MAQKTQNGMNFAKTTCGACGETVTKRQSLRQSDGKRICRKHLGKK